MYLENLKDVDNLRIRRSKQQLDLRDNVTYDNYKVAKKGVNQVV